MAIDSLVQPMESQELPSPKDLGIGITIGCVKDVHVGDTFEFPVTVSWSVNGSSLLVLSTNSANAKGLTQISLSQESSRSVVDGQEKASVLFKYKIQFCKHIILQKSLNYTIDGLGIQPR